jgi:hypothetical protein
MSSIDLSSVRAIVADERADVRAYLESRLRELGVERVDAVAAAAAGQAVIALLPTPSEPDGTFPDRQAIGDAARELISRFTHDIASPLLLMVALTDLVARLDVVDETLRADLKQIHGAAREISGRVRALGIAAGSARPPKSQP